MTSLQYFSRAAAVFLLCISYAMFGQGTQGGAGRVPPAAKAAPATMPPVTPLQGPDGATGEPKPTITSATTPPAAPESVESQDVQPSNKVYAAGCVAMNSNGQYELRLTSGTQLVLTGNTAGLRSGSVVELFGSVGVRGGTNSASTQSSPSTKPLFIVNSYSLLSRSCDISSVAIHPGKASASSASMGAASSASPQGGQGTGGEPQTRAATAAKSLAAPVPTQPSPMHFQTALTALRQAEQELKAAGLQAGSQGDLALRTVQIAIGNLELAAKQQK